MKHNYTSVQHLPFLRALARLIPLKHKLAFLIKRDLINGKDLSIQYFRDWHICTTVTDLNRSTLEEVILGGPKSLPEAWLINKLRTNFPSDMILVDVGGNIGGFFANFIDKCSLIIVFEPVPRLSEVIERSEQFNNSGKVRLIKKAISDRQGSAWMLDDNNSSVVEKGTSMPTVEVEVNTLDNELNTLERIDLIKIDVEGYEMHVLQGAVEVIQKHRPTLFIEVHPLYITQYGFSHHDILQWLDRQDYSIAYYSFLEEQRMSKAGRIFSRWKGNRGVHFLNRQAFLADIEKKPKLSSYHLYCEPA